MQEHSFLPEFNDDDVIELADNNLVKIGRLREAIRIFFDGNIEELLRKYCLDNFNICIPFTRHDYRSNPQYDRFMSQGVRCKLLKLGFKNWQSGRIKLRLSLEFEPDEPENKEPPSPLDDIRQSINQ